MKHEDAQVPPADAGRLETPVRHVAEALRLAAWIEDDMTCQGDAEIAAELRRQHGEIEHLRTLLWHWRWTGYSKQRDAETEASLGDWQPNVRAKRT